jgi:hypothetical protein
MTARERGMLILVVCLVAFCAVASAQTTGRIAGTVKDPMGAVLAAAKVTATSTATGEQRDTATDAAGNYAP